MITHDQYGNTIPDDLVTMPAFDDSDPVLQKIVDADWYEASGVLLVSAKAIDYLSEDDPVDARIDLTVAEVLKVDDCLKRWSSEDGWYHA